MTRLEATSSSSAAGRPAWQRRPGLVAGVYAAGDLTPGLQLVSVAAASGVVAGVACAHSFFGRQGAPTSPEPAPATGQH